MQRLENLARQLQPPGQPNSPSAGQQRGRRSPSAAMAAAISACVPHHHHGGALPHSAVASSEEAEAVVASPTVAWEPASETELPRWSRLVRERLISRCPLSTARVRAAPPAHLHRAPMPTVHVPRQPRAGCL